MNLNESNTTIQVFITDAITVRDMFGEVESGFGQKVANRAKKAGLPTVWANRAGYAVRAYPKAFLEEIKKEIEQKREIEAMSNEQIADFLKSL
jgi:hypothetical protein